MSTQRHFGDDTRILKERKVRGVQSQVFALPGPTLQMAARSAILLKALLTAALDFLGHLQYQERELDNGAGPATPAEGPFLIPTFTEGIAKATQLPLEFAEGNSSVNRAAL